MLKCPMVEECSGGMSSRINYIGNKKSFNINNIVNQILENIEKWKLLEEQKNKIIFIVWIILSNTSNSSAASHNSLRECWFNSTDWFKKVLEGPISKNVWWSKEWNRVKWYAYVRTWLKTRKIKKWKLKLSKTDQIKYTVWNRLCVYRYADFNFEKFKEDGHLDYLKIQSKKHKIDFRLVLSLIHQESKFKWNAKSETLAGWYGQLTTIAVDEINKVYWKKHTVKEVKKNPKLNIDYTIIYLSLMIRRHWSIEKWVKHYNWDKNEMKHYLRVVMNKYNSIYKNLKF